MHTHVRIYTSVCDVPRFLADTKNKSVCKIGRIHKVEAVCS